MTWGRNGGDENDRYDLFLYTKYLGVRGIVTDKHGTGIENVTVAVIGRESHAARTTADGEYWRLLLPGNYTLKVNNKQN